MKPEPQLTKKQQYDKERYRKNREKILKQRAEYREQNRQLLRNKARDYYTENKQEHIERSKRSIRSRMWHYATEKGRENRKKFDSKPINKHKNKIRNRTRCKYGKLPKGYEYHHTEPYHEDKWIGIDRSIHRRLK